MPETELLHYAYRQAYTTSELPSVTVYCECEVVNCIAHRLELSVKNAVDYVNGVSHFRSLIDELYKVYRLSPKNHPS